MTHDLAVENFNFAPFADQFGDALEIIKPMRCSQSGKARLMVRFEHGVAPVVVTGAGVALIAQHGVSKTVSARAEKPKLNQRELSDLIRSGTSSDGWTRDDCLRVTQYLDVDGTPAKKATWHTIVKNLGHSAKLPVSQITALAKLMGMESAVYDHAAVEASQREQVRQQTQGLEAVVKYASGLNFINARAGRIPHRKFHDEWSVRPLHARVEAVQALLKTHPLKSADFLGQGREISVLIQKHLAPQGVESEAVEQQQPAPQVFESDAQRNERWQTEWNGSADIRREFGGDKRAFTAYKRVQSGDCGVTGQNKRSALRAEQIGEIAEARGALKIAGGASKTHDAPPQGEKPKTESEYRTEFQSNAALRKEFGSFEGFFAYQKIRFRHMRRLT